MPRGHLTVHTGPMFSGKTTALLNQVERYDTVEAFIPATDDRYEQDAITSHTGDSLPATVLAPDNPHAMGDAVSPDVDAVVVDEAQFFDTALIDAIKQLRTQRAVLVTGLDRDFRAEPFHPVPAILSLADTLHHHTARCDVCRAPASRTQRIIDGEPAPRDAPLIDVAEKGRYEARCTAHHTVPE